MGAEQKRRDCVKSSWEGKTRERAECQTEAETDCSIFFFCDGAYMRERNKNQRTAKALIFQECQKVAKKMAGESRKNAESEPAAKCNECRKVVVVKVAKK